MDYISWTQKLHIIWLTATDHESLAILGSAALAIGLLALAAPLLRRYRT